MTNTRIETAEEKKERVFQHYKNRLIKEVRNTSGNENIRFICIEYLCGFHKIDPFVMAASLIKEGITIVFDDSSISRKENRRKEIQVNKLLA